MLLWCGITIPIKLYAMISHPPQRYASFACTSSQGRLSAEKEEMSVFARSPFQRDRDRIIHSIAFRRLKHKTQVFLYHEGDYYRTRLTHSLEVAQIARTMARALQLNEDLAEAVALGHDLGHPPFGHAGETALNAVMEPYGGFDHNEQTIRVLCELEERYAAFNGLNLCFETLEGIIKHNGPLSSEQLRPTIKALHQQHDFKITKFPVLEAQLANMADDIAYLSHDVDDSLRAGLLTLDQLRPLPVIGQILSEIAKDHGDIKMSRLSHELNRRLIAHFVLDLLHSTQKNIDEAQPETVDDIRNNGDYIASHSAQTKEELRVLRAFLFTHSWRHYKVNRMTSKSKKALTALFERLFEEPDLLPTEWQNKFQKHEDKKKARIIADYLASMTDRYALLEYERIFEMGPILV